MNRKAKRRFGSVMVVLALVLAFQPSAAQSQRRPRNGNYVAWAREFMRAMYPDLSGKKYFVTVQGGARYDEPDELLRSFKMYVGNGPLGTVKERKVGCLFLQKSGESLNQFPAPPSPKTGDGEKATPQAPPCYGNPTPYAAMGSYDVYAEQFVTVDVLFAKNGKLLRVLSDGVGLGNVEKSRELDKLAADHPKMTVPEFVTALKKAGAKYGPGDEKEFIRNLPLAKLEPFLGKLKLISVDFVPLSEDLFNARDWPKWEVKVEARQSNGAIVIYEMTFDRFKGDLISLNDASLYEDRTKK
jgi:hypothetical protein